MFAGYFHFEVSIIDNHDVVPQCIIFLVVLEPLLAQEICLLSMIMIYIYILSHCFRLIFTQYVLVLYRFKSHSFVCLPKIYFPFLVCKLFKNLCIFQLLLEQFYPR